GIDFPDITHVFNYDFPTKKENYVHRIGRTARNGRTGKAISLVSEYELHYKKAAEDYIELEIPIKTLPDHEEIQLTKQAFQKKQKEKVVLKKQKGEVFNETITKLSIGGGKKSKLRAGDVVGTICALPGLSQEDIGVIDVRDSITYVEIFNAKGPQVAEELQKKPIKGKLRKVKIML
ncbi:MAG: DbpA RNA binding domain-containing protein, partial [Lachnospiraceae bacterium]|nr:DbpA RNA binding domain-containing protein [Lachnospiraceae bacterium]